MVMTAAPLQPSSTKDGTTSPDVPSQDLGGRDQNLLGENSREAEAQGRGLLGCRRQKDEGAGGGQDRHEAVTSQGLGCPCETSCFQRCLGKPQRRCSSAPEISQASRAQPISSVHCKGFTLVQPSWKGHRQQTCSPGRNWKKPAMAQLPQSGRETPCTAG